jgi:serine protease Do
MSASATAVNTLQAVSDTLASIAERVGNTVVAVHAGRRYPSSGFVWAPEVIVTAAHTIKRDDNITILLPSGEIANATVAGRDAGSDIAILRVGGLKIEPVERGDVNSVLPGHIVLALARFAASHVSMDYGLVARVGPAWRTWQGGEIDRFVALDGELRPGYSGGPLVDARGLILGVSTSAFLRGTGTVIPAATASRVADELLSRGRVSRSYLGMGMQPAELPATIVSDLNLESNRGLLVATVDAGAAAEKAGIMVGDVLISLAGQPCRALGDVLRVLGSSRAGQSVTAAFVRGGKRNEITIVLGERPQRKCCS